jgi:hypothetical protein
MVELEATASSSTSRMIRTFSFQITSHPIYLLAANSTLSHDSYLKQPLESSSTDAKTWIPSIYRLIHSIL